VVAVWESDKPQVIPNTEEARTTPFVVAYTEDGVGIGAFFEIDK
jgi:molecular chaperone DnaK (HSP70)